MAITDQRYVPDDGRVQLDGDDVSGSVKKLSVSVPKRKKETETSLGGDATVISDWNAEDTAEVSITLYDDWNLAASATALHKTLWDAYIAGTVITDMDVAPAGSTVGMNEHTLTTVQVLQCPPFAELDSDATQSATVEATLSVVSFSSLAIA